MALVSIVIVSWNSARFLSKCLDSIRCQSHPDLEMIVVDNASEDGSVELVRRLYPEVKLLVNGANEGFARGQNMGIQASRGEYVLSLNPDVILTQTYVSEVLRAANLDNRVGMVTGKLYRIMDDFCMDGNILDSTGMYFTPEGRHFDRGSQEVDRGQYDQLEYVFGVSAAAALYKREMIEDVKLSGEYFDEDFFAYREDADLSWRAQIMGWKALYAPQAVAYHVRKVLPTNRRQVSWQINMHSVKNRFMMRIKNQTWSNYAGMFLPMMWRDLQVIGYVLLVEHRSLPGLWQVVKLLPKMLRKRRAIMQRKKVPDSYIRQWFCTSPSATRYEKTGLKHREQR